MNINKILSSMKVTMYDFDPNATTATDIAWVDMQDILTFCVGFFRTVGSSDLTMKILANTASDGSGDEETIVSKTFTEQPDNTGDYVFLECSAAQVRQKGEEEGEALRYVSANLTFATGTDEGVVIYISEPRYKYDGLTADYIS